MESPLVTHAKLNVWCATNQDFQYHINLPRITPERGVLREYPVLWDNLAVPKTSKMREYFHFYQIGHLPAKTFDFIGKENEWINYMDLNRDNNILVDVYLVSGAIVPRDHIWVTKLYNKNIVVAIQNNFRIDYGVCDATYFNGVAYKDKFTLDNTQAIIRFYSNAYFDKVSYIENAVDPKQPIRMVYKQVKSQEDFSNFIIAANSIEREFGNEGLGVYYQDGFVTQKPMGFAQKYVGSYMGFMWDESFDYEITYPIKHLPAFISEKNRGVRKYLLVVDAVYDKIDYHDDIDFYIVNNTTGKGVYFNRNFRFALTMVTHNSYAINAEAIEGYIGAHDFLGTIDNCSIRMMVRHGGREVGLFNQKNRIEELYQLNLKQITEAHINTPSLVPAWRAPALEASSYVELMSAPSHLVTNDLVIDAYGYNGICSQFANPLVTVRAGEVVVPEIGCIPDKSNNLGYRALFTYDNTGKYLGHFTNNSLSPYAGVPNTFKTAATVEVINGALSTDEVSAWVNVDVTDNEIEQYGFRCYISTGDIHGILNKWEDVTGSKLYTYTKATLTSPAKIRWNWGLLSQANLYPAVKSNKTVHVYEWSKPAGVVYDGCLEIEVKATQQWGNNKLRKPLGIPAGNVDVFANGLSLIKNVDYFMNWPMIVIVNRDINRSKTINVTVRSYGFGDPRTNKPFEPQEIGFVKDGMLSINGVYNVRNNKCVRVLVDNKLVKMDSKNYGEYLVGSNYTDGKPYSITDYAIPIENLLPGRDTWTLYKETLDIDKTVSDYLTPRLPENKALTPVVNVSRWTVISPVVSTILHAFKNEFNFDRFVDDNYTSEDLTKWFKPFEWLLQFDPAYHNVDENYFRIEPHSNTTVMTITQKQYEFLEWIIVLHLNGRVDLTNNVKIG